MKTQNLSKKEAENILKNGGVIFLEDEDNFLYASGINKDKYFDQTGFNFTEWFKFKAPENGWNVKLI